LLGLRKATTLTVLLVVLAVATILISPDPTDDVDGVLCSHQTIKILAKFSIPKLTLTVVTHFQLLLPIASADSSRLLCGLRC